MSFPRISSNTDRKCETLCLNQLKAIQQTQFCAMLTIYIYIYINDVPMIEKRIERIVFLFTHITSSFTPTRNCFCERKRRSLSGYKCGYISFIHDKNSNTFSIISILFVLSFPFFHETLISVIFSDKIWTIKKDNRFGMEAHTDTHTKYMTSTVRYAFTHIETCVMSVRALNYQMIALMWLR